MKGTLFAAALGIWLVAAGSAFSAEDQELLEPPEQDAMADTVQHALEYNRTDQASEWVNPDTGRSGAVSPVRTFQNEQGQPCREFVTTITIGGKLEQGYGTACRQPDGSWQIVAEDLQKYTAPTTSEVHVYREPERYYAYPAGFYGPSPIYLSFSYVYRSGHAYRGRYYLDGPAFRHRHPLYVRERLFIGPGVYRHYPWRGRPRYR